MFRELWMSLHRWNRIYDLDRLRVSILVRPLPWITIAFFVVVCLRRASLSPATDNNNTNTNTCQLLYLRRCRWWWWWFLEMNWFLCSVCSLRIEDCEERANGWRGLIVVCEETRIFRGWHISSKNRWWLCQSGVNLQQKVAEISRNHTGKDT